MSIRFPCSDCDQLLSAREEKVGRKVRCPKCKAVLRVPTAEDAEEAMARRKDEVSHESEEEDSYFDLIVYDDAPAHGTDARQETAEVDRDRVSIPRSMVYTQGVLIAAVALVAFVMGYLIGGATRPDSQAPQLGAAGPPPVVVTGQLQHVADGAGAVPDEGSVMIALPIGVRLSGEKLRSAGLGPADEAPRVDHAGRRAIESLGGAYARANEYGSFRVRLRPGRYHVLLISHEARRDFRQPLDPQDLAAIGSYFDAADRLIGESKYSWQLVEVAPGATITHNFDRSET